VRGCDLYRSIAVVGGAVTELPVGVQPPGVGVAVGSDRDGVCAARADVLECGTVGGCDLHWSAAVVGGAVTELPVGVQSPRVGVAVGSDRDGVCAPGADPLVS